MLALVGAVFVASLVGSAHCAGMCGGFVAFAAGDVRGRHRALAVPVAYGAGRLVAYASLGAVAGALGDALDAAGSFAGVQRGAAVVAGVLIVVWGVVSLLRALGVRGAAVEPPRALGRLFAHGVRSLALRPPVERALVIGVLAALLPCGWLYAFVVTAAGTGTAAAGALVMAVFWLGTMPMLVTLGTTLEMLAGPVRRHVPAACAVAMIVVGLVAVGGRVRAPRLAHDAPVGAGATIDVVPQHGHARH